MPSKQPFIEIINKKYGKLTVIAEGNPNLVGRRVVCICECGKQKEVRLSHLKNGSIVSCGCRISEFLIKFNTKHGLRKTPLYKTWCGMKERCCNPKSRNYKNYGGRGIKVCKEWMDCFKCFYDWAISNGYSEELYLDREQNDGDYCPSNCRWITQKQNCRNTRKNRNISYNGVNICVSEWAEKLGINRSLISDRLNKLNWSIENTLSTPARKLNHK